MANLGNLIVRGVTRILGDAYANKFIGNLQGNADTATSAIKASTADSATSATSANKASIATAVQDYGTSDYREIKIGYQGSGLSSSTITHAVGFTDGGTKIKDISKDEFRNWLTTDSGTWPITVSNATNSANADTVDGYHVSDNYNLLYKNVTNLTCTLSSITTDYWYVKILIQSSYQSIVNQKMYLIASYSNLMTKAELQVYGYYLGYKYTASTYNADTITGIASTRQGASQVIWLRMKKPIQYDGGISDGNISIYSNYIASAEVITSAPSGVIFTDTLQSDGQHILSGNIKAASFEKNGSSDSYVLLGGGGHKLLSDFSMAHSHPYLPLSGGTLTGSIEMGNNPITSANKEVLISYSGLDTYLKGESHIYLDAPNLYKLVGDITYPLIHSGNFNSYAPKLDGTGASGTWGISISGNAATASNASAVNGVSFTWDGEITSSQWIAAWESGTSIRTMSAYNTFISMCSYLDEGASDVTDGTMFITSYATDNGFADPNGTNKPYKRKAIFLWNYINSKCGEVYQPKGNYLTNDNLSGYATTTWVNSNYYTCSESDSRYIQSETDPVWNAAKGNYYTKTECDNRYQPKGTYLTEQNLQGYATQEWVRGEEYLYRSGGTMDARAEIGITTKLFIGNSTSPDTCYTKFNCILHGGGDESNPNWVIRDNGYSEFKSSVSANAFYASSDIRLKNILDDINIDFDKLKLIPKKYYTWKGSDILQLGTIAQDIQKIYPEVVSKNENGYLSVDYSKLSIIALAAIDKLNERIKELECQIKL